MDPASWERTLTLMATFEEAEKYAQAIAAREIAKSKMRTGVRNALADKVLTDGLRAQAWLEADPSKVNVRADGTIEIACEGWPLGCGSHESEVMARLGRRMFADDAEREAHAWMFEPEDDK